MPNLDKINNHSTGFVEQNTGKYITNSGSSQARIINCRLFSLTLPSQSGTNSYGN